MDKKNSFCRRVLKNGSSDKKYRSNHFQSWQKKIFSSRAGSAGTWRAVCCACCWCCRRRETGTRAVAPYRSCGSHVTQLLKKRGKVRTLRRIVMPAGVDDVSIVSWHVLGIVWIVMEAALLKRKRRKDSITWGIGGRSFCTATRVVIWSRLQSAQGSFPV